MSNCNCGSLHTNAKHRYDPTRTITVRKSWEADVLRRYNKIKKDVKETVIDNDVFSLNSNVAADAAPFQFVRSPEKISMFMDWLTEQQSLGVLGIQKGTSVASAAESSWMNTYIYSSYQRAIRQATSNVKRQGGTISDRFIDTAFNRPIHADTAGIIYTRSFSKLKGITDEVDKQVSGILARGVIDGIGTRQLAAQINDRVSKIGITRARTLARTEVIAAHAEATLNMYQEIGVEGVIVQAEFTTTGDDSVCPECDALQGKIYTIEESRGIIPVHPNCRCAFLPVIPNAKSINIQ